jgi:engulfment/cell motility protein 1
VAELVRILIEQVVGQAARTKDIQEVEEELVEFEYGRLRELQMELLELTFEDEWGQHLHQVRDELKHEALQFVKEQRIRCLLQGAWFPRAVQHKNGTEDGYSGRNGTRMTSSTAWRYVKLSHNRRYLHYADFDLQTKQEPLLDALSEKIDLSTISSVVSNVSASSDGTSSISSTSTLKTASHSPKQTSTTKITINSFVGGENKPQSNGEPAERAILTLMPPTHSLASEWLDGLLMLLNQAPITAETNKLVGLVSEYSLKIRLLNVRLDDGFAGPPEGAGVVPSREGLDEDYYYEV